MKRRKIIKTLPKSKLGGAAAGAYLLLVFFLLTVAAFGGGGLHGRAAMASVFVVILTLPLSWVALWMSDSLNPAPAYELVLFLAVIAVGAIINAGVIYLAVGFVSRALRASFRKLSQ